MTVTLTPELLAELRKKAEAATGCGRPGSVRGDPECTGCNQDCYFCKCGPLAPGQAP